MLASQFFEKSLKFHSDSILDFLSRFAADGSALSRAAPEMNPQVPCVGRVKPLVARA